MKTISRFSSLLVLFLGLFSAVSAQSADADHPMMKEIDEPVLIQLTQLEGIYTATSLELPAGQYVFEVTNADVDKDLGFYLQDETDGQVSNSGLEALIGNGQSSRTGVVTLTPGTYRYSCPLNPTPHYTIKVE